MLILAIVVVNWFHKDGGSGIQIRATDIQEQNK